jgi:histidine ammonia-lyase
MQTALHLTGRDLTIANVVAVARYGKPIDTELDDAAAREVQFTRDWIEQAVAEDQVIYGVTTGFGKFSDRRLTPTEAQALSRNLILSHATGVGEPFDDEIVRAAMLIRANALAKGYSGVRLDVIRTLIAMLNRHVTPVIPRKGSLGASGDLAPLSHLALVLSQSLPREDAESDPYGYYSGRAKYENVEMSGAKAMEQAGIPRLALTAKEGLALNNGATFSAAIATLVLHDAVTLLVTAEIALAMTLEALRGTLDAYLPYPHQARNHVGQQVSARNVRRLVQGSTLATFAPLTPEQGIQDAYSVRCAPQVLGAVRDTLRFAHQTIHDEINAATDNPLLFVRQLARHDRAVSAGNFHGEPLAFALDFMKIALTEIGSIAERRVFRLVDSRDSRGLPAFLVGAGAGLNSGFMIPQYTAAALVSECKTLAHPDSVDSITSSANQEDHVSMSANAGLHAIEVLRNVEHVVAIELLTAAQALDFHLARREPEPPTLGVGTRAAYEFIRQGLGIRHVEEDRTFAPDIQRVREAIRGGAIAAAVDEALRAHGGAPLIPLSPAKDDWADIHGE